MSRLAGMALVIGVMFVTVPVHSAPQCIHPIMAQGEMELEDAIVNGNGPFEAESENASITTEGAIEAGGAPPPLSLPPFPNNNAKNDTKASVVPAGYYDKVEVENTTTFTGGTYVIKELRVKKNATAIFAPGDYFVDKLELDDRSSLIIDPPGEVRFFITDKFKIDKDSSANGAGSAGNLQVYLYDDANFEIKERTVFTGLVYSDSPDSEIKIDGPTKINGALITAGEVESEDGLTLNLDEDVLNAFDDGTTICGQGFDHFLINHDGFGINCQAELIAVSTVDALGDPFTGHTGVIVLETGTGAGSWVATTGDGDLLDATPNDGTAKYAFSGNESMPIYFSLDYQAGPAVFNIDVYDSNTPTLRDDDSEGDIRFGPSGFMLTATPLSTPPPPFIAPFTTPQVAGTDFPVYLAAYGQTPTDPVCGIIETYTGGQDLKFWIDYVDPGSGSVQPTVDNNPIGTAEASAAAQPVTFTNGQAVVTGKYKDVGLLQLLVKDDTVADPDLPNGIRGATANFVVKPHHFELTAIEDGAGNPNPAAADANGLRFVAAGDPFTATVTVFDAEGDITPNYGQESGPETVRLTASLVDPAVGNNPPVTAAAGFGSFVNGQATGGDFIWPEVGIVTLRPSVGDGTYFDAGDVVGDDTGNVGRFYAHHFTTSLNAPQFMTGCSSGSFTYIGENFGYAIAPVVTVTARAASGATAQNYAGGFFKIDNTSLANRTYTAATGVLDASGVPPTTFDPVPTPVGSGVGTLTFGSGTGLLFIRGAPQPAFDANIQLSIDVIDTDGAAALTNPVVFGNPGGIAFDNGAGQRYGRVRVLNTLGSELVNLNVPMRAEYFLNAGTGFVPNTADSCTGSVTVDLDNYTEDLADGDTCVLDSGFPGNSSEGCALAAPFGLRFREPPLGGDFNLFLRAPGAGNSGSVDATVDVPDWLEFDWDATAPGLEDPVGTATFGIFEGEQRQIYMREIY